MAVSAERNRPSIGLSRLMGVSFSFDTRINTIAFLFLATLFSRARQPNRDRILGGGGFMRTTTGRMIAVAMTVSLVGWPAPGKASTQSQATPDLTGTWILNSDLSDKPASRPSGGSGERGGRGRPGGPGGGMGGFGGGMGGPGGGGMGGPGEGGMPNKEEMERQRAVTEAAMRAPTRLVLAKSETGLLMTDEQGVSARIPLDGKKETGAVNGVPYETTSKWEEGRLRVERKFKGGLKLVEQFILSADGGQLTVMSKVEGGRMPEGARSIKRTYDRRESAQDVS